MTDKERDTEYDDIEDPNKRDKPPKKVVERRRVSYVTPTKSQKQRKTREKSSSGDDLDNLRKNV